MTQKQCIIIFPIQSTLKAIRKLKSLIINKVLATNGILFNSLDLPLAVVWSKAGPLLNVDCAP